MPDGRAAAIDNEKIDMVQFYRDYLANASLSEIGTAAFWFVAENALKEKPTATLYNLDMGVTFVADDQGLGTNPDVEGQTSFVWANGGVANFASDRYSLNGGCPVIRSYDAIGASGTAVVTHKYRSGATLGPGAIVMNRNAALGWNTVMQSHGWFDILDVTGGIPTNPSPESVLMAKVLAGVLPGGCQRAVNPTPVPEAPPKVTALYQNVPNPFNPTTTIRFDLAQDARVELQVFDVAGHAVRTLVDGKVRAGSRRQVIWNGLDDAGRRVSSGIYFYRLVADDFTATRKLVALK